MTPSEADLLPPAPVPTPTSRPFWDGLAEGRVRLQRCGACEAWVFYPRTRCPRCLADALAWHDVSGAATLHAWTVCHRAPAPHFEALVPFVLAVVELDEGVRMTTTLVDADPAALRAGLRLAPCIDDSGPVPLLRYEVAGTQA